jgi:serine/threonine-protein kinase HipA
LGFDQVASVAEYFLTISSYTIEKNLSNQVIHDIKANLNRMANQ